MEVRRRRTKHRKQERGSAVTNNSQDKRNDRPRHVQNEQHQGSFWLKNKQGMLGLLFVFIYIPFVIVVNPITVGLMYRRWTRKPCEGVCSIQGSSVAFDPNSCTPVDPTKLIFIRIPKTATTTVLSVMERGFERKAVARIDLRELEDLVSSLPLEGASFERMGFHDVQKYKERLEWFYKRASNLVLRPPYYGQDHTLYEGHLHYFNFTKNAQRLAGPPPWYLDHLPKWILDWYHLPTQQEKLEVQQISFLRHPHDRLKSMYYYDRHDARTTAWREELVRQRGNVTLEECLLDPTCIETNQLSKWCSIQVEMVCGVGKSCHPATVSSLQIAKDRIDKDMLFVGISDRMGESLSLMKNLLPTYLEGVSLEDVPREKTSNHILRRESSFSQQAQAALDELCALDLKLYNYANQILTERIQNCQ